MPHEISTKRSAQSHVSNTITATAVAVLLCGCGNAFESLDMGDWKPGGSAVVPKNPKSTERPRLTVLDAGIGQEIKAGSLVHARVTLKQVLPGSDSRLETYIQKLPDVWFWLGDHSEIPGHVAYKWGELIDLGDEELRATFVGVRSGSRVSVLLEGKPNYPGTQLPTHGFIFNGDSSGISIAYPGQSVQFSHRAEYEFTILDVCEGRLLYRRGTLRQWGYRPTLWVEHGSYPFAREGVLEWAAIEADCDSPNDLRVEMGPGYRVSSGTLVPIMQRDYRTASPRGKMLTSK